MALYIDASALIPLIVAEPDSAWSEAQVASKPPPFVSDFAAAEVAASISKFVRMGLVTADAGRELLADFDVWLAREAVQLETSAHDVAAAAELVRRFKLKLRAPDALHLALTRRYAATLVTRDKAMARAAEALGLSFMPLPA